MPYIGTILKSGIPELCLYDTQKNEPKVLNYKEAEQAILDDLKIIGEDNDKLHLVYKYRFNRNPIIGDKFSSRHGQKGVLSILWPQEDMPFTESGITPDVIINPHAFPSRMTIGMLIESMAGKSGSIHGRFQDARPFQRYYNDDIVGYFGEELKAAGYQYHGSEVMYSGVFGTQLKAHIFIGVVYYQRLRHMVADKYQARATGPVDILTHQPVKGRKRHGGIRFGEMERDSILAHGAAFLLQDRLMRCSDYSEGYICKKCGSMLACYVEKGQENVSCKECTGETQKVAIPYVLRYLTNELAAMNIRVQFKSSY
jgi:DNA-directed RNA polymerase I subunit RPA2